MEETDVAGVPNAFVRPRNFNLRAEIDAHPWEAGPDEAVTAKVRFEPEMAWWAARTLHVQHTDGPLEVELPVANVDAFIGWLLSFDDSAVILEPPDLRRQLVERVEAALV
jgi:predicted DNA-binding transcriptional regulator YafY